MKRKMKLLSLVLAVFIFILVPTQSFAAKDMYIYKSEYIQEIDGVRYKYNAKITADLVVHTEIYKEVKGQFEFDDRTVFYVTDDGTSYEYSTKNNTTIVTEKVFERVEKAISVESLYDDISPLANDWIRFGEEYQHRVLVQAQTVEQLAVTIVKLCFGQVSVEDVIGTARDLLDDVIEGWKYVGEVTERDASYGDGYKRFRIGTRAYRYANYSYPLGDWYWKIYLR